MSGMTRRKFVRMGAQGIALATIPAISTHQQQGEAARAMAGIPPQLIRLCVGGEHPDDVIADLDQALRKVTKGRGSAGRKTAGRKTESKKTKKSGSRKR